MSTNHSRSTRRRNRVTALVAALGLVGALSACSSDADSTDAATSEVAATETAAAETAAAESAAVETAAAEPAPTEAAAETAATDTTAAAGAEPSAATPAKIVSLSPSSTETLFAIGAGAQVIAVDQYSNYPAEAKALPHDLSGFEPNVEAIAALKPDLVIHDGTTKLHEQLSALKIADFAAAAPTDLKGVYAQIEQLGAATGHVGEAAELVSKMTTEIDQIMKDAPKAEGRTYFHELDNTLYSVTSKSFIGGLYAMFGLTNIADAISADNPYPQLSAEKVIEANPQLIFLADASFGESAETVAKRPGWDAIEAVKSGNVVALPEDVPSRWGPRVVDMVKLISTSLAKVPAAS